MVFCDFSSSVVSESKLSRQDNEKKSTRNTLIKEVALSTIKEVVVSLGLTGLCCLFVATPAVPSLIIFTISVLAVNLLLRVFTAQQSYELYLITQRKHDPDEVRFKERVISLLQFVGSYDFSILHTMTSNVLVHETGHAIAASIVYQNSKPKIEIFPFIGGETRYQPTPLSQVGKYLGFSGSKALVSAAGAGLGIISASIMIGLSHAFKKDHPNLSLHLLCSGIMTIAQHVIYALSALWEASPVSGHDFVSLWKYGVHPLVSLICIVALPVFVKLALCGISRCRQMATPTVCEKAR